MFPYEDFPKTRLQEKEAGEVRFILHPVEEATEVAEEVSEHEEFPCTFLLNIE